MKIVKENEIPIIILLLFILVNVITIIYARYKEYKLDSVINGIISLGEEPKFV